MKLNFEGERVVAVVAHPDDAELLCAGTLARAKRDGAEIAICVLCSGDKGQATGMHSNLKGVRRREMARSAKLVGAKLFTGDTPDGTLQDDGATRLKLVGIYRQFKPTLVLAHSAEDYHPDHRAASALAEAASWFSASRGHKTATVAMESSPALWWMDTLNMSGFEPGFFVDISDYVGLKVNMLCLPRKPVAARGGQGFFAARRIDAPAVPRPRRAGRRGRGRSIPGTSSLQARPRLVKIIPAMPARAFPA